MKEEVVVKEKRLPRRLPMRLIKLLKRSLCKLLNLNLKGNW